MIIDRYLKKSKKSIWLGMLFIGGKPFFWDNEGVIFLFKEVSSDIKLLLASVTITVIGILLPWVGVHDAPMRGFHLKYGINLLVLLIICLIVVHLSRKMLASILIVVINFMAFFIVLRAYVDLFSSPQSPSFFNFRIGIFVTGLGIICMIISGISGIIKHKSNNS